MVLAVYSWQRLGGDVELGAVFSGKRLNEPRGSGKISLENFDRVCLGYATSTYINAELTTSSDGVR